MKYTYQKTPDNRVILRLDGRPIAVYPDVEGALRHTLAVTGEAPEMENKQPKRGRKAKREVAQ